MDSGSHHPRSVTEVGSLILQETPALLKTISESSGGRPALLSPDYLETHFILWDAKLNQHICFKGILTSKFVSKNMLIWKRGSAFVSTEDRKLLIPYL